jgi:hypothetical protein
MNRIGLFAIALLCAVALLDARIILERSSVPENYALLGQANPNQQIDFIIGLKQRNLDALEVK